MGANENSNYLQQNIYIPSFDWYGMGLSKKLVKRFIDVAIEIEREKKRK